MRRQQLRRALMLGGSWSQQPLVAPRIFAGGVAQNLAILSLLYAVVASNWDLTLGYSGIFNFAHVAFFGVAAYVAAISTMKFGVPVWWDLLLAVVVGSRAQRAVPRFWRCGSAASMWRWSPSR